jgi:predicted lipid-binding transport protein (Tim44 family)
MRFVSPVSAALVVLFCTSVEAQGQAGRFIPAPRIPAGGGWRFIPHIPFFHGNGSGGEDVCWVIAAIVGIIVLAVIGWKIGQALGRRGQPASPNAGQPMSPINIPPLEDLIIRPDEVEEKVRKTTRLLEALAQNAAAFKPSELRAFITATFTRVQQCWEARDYGPVKKLLGPTILAQHEELLRAMSRSGEINRIEDLRVRRLEFVHVWCPADANSHEVTALITFEARVYFCNDRSGAFLRGSPKVIPYQEFWVFRRHGDLWRLVSINRSHDWTRLEAANRVDAMTDLERQNAEEGVIVLREADGHAGVGGSV